MYKDIDIQEFKEIVNSSYSMADVGKKAGISEIACRLLARALGVRTTSRRNNKGLYKHTQQSVRDMYLSNKFSISSGALRVLLERTGIKEHKCERCGLTTWQGYPIRLDLHHKNGNHYDNSENNLMLLCPNCHRLVGFLDSEEKKARRVANRSEDRSNVKIPKVSRKFECTAEELLSLLQKHKAYTKVAELFHVTDNAIRKRCKRLNIFDEVDPIIQANKKELARRNRADMTDARKEQIAKQYIEKHPESGVAKPVDCIDAQTGELIKTYPYMYAVVEDGFDRKLVKDCCDGTQQRHKGYMWHYH